MEWENGGVGELSSSLERSRTISLACGVFVETVVNICDLFSNNTKHVVMPFFRRVSLCSIIVKIRKMKNLLYV